jgi:hypothetical protein
MLELLHMRFSVHAKTTNFGLELEILGGSLTRVGCGMDHGFRKAREDN